MCLMSATVRKLLLLTLFVSEVLAHYEDRGCDLVVPDITNGHSAKPGDNGFSIFLSGQPEKFVPGEAYTVTLKNINTDANILPRFIGFSLMIEPEKAGRAGSFEITDDTMTQFAADCPTTITHTSLNPKSEVSIKWRAPPENSGCVLFKALIVEQKNIWYVASGGLKKQLCEEEFVVVPNIDGCQACSEAKYEITFESLWSRQTHPKDFPSDASFSDIIGASHSNLYSMWEKGTKASEGIQQIARDGETSILESEFVNNARTIRTIIKSRGLKHSNTKSFAVFRVDQEHHLLSIVSKIIPSPDWIVGKSNLDLCKGDKWIDGDTIELYPLDAGIDAAITYKERDLLPKSEYEKIRDITPSFPNNEKSPFFDASGAKMKPLARLILTKKRQYDIPCSNIDSNYDADLRPECELTEWSSFSPCSVTCGEGYKTRKRAYVFDDTRGFCNEILTQKERCKIFCDLNGSITFPQQTGRSPRCAVTQWSPWSECSTTCDKGIRRRKRNYLDTSYEKYCTLKITDEESCQSNIPCKERETCAATDWSEWSPCSVTCGKGIQIRMKKLINSDHERMCIIPPPEHQPCVAETEVCVVDPEEARKKCLMDRVIGPCRGYYPRWYFDNKKKMCIQFIYGGCRGNQNNFESYEGCHETCKMLKEEPQYMTPVVRSLPEQAVDCQVSEWSEWSSCSVTCGKGQVERHRTIVVSPRNGGKECPKKSTQRRKCTKPNCA